MGRRVYGSVNVYTDDGRSALFSYSAGNGGHHWGNMLRAPGICAWGTGTGWFVMFARDGVGAAVAPRAAGPSR